MQKDLSVLSSRINLSIWNSLQPPLVQGRAGKWLNFPPPIPEHFCPFLEQIARMGLILPRWVSICPDGVSFQNTTSNLCSFLSPHTPLSGISTYTKPTPPHPTPVSWPELECRQNELTYGQNETPTGKYVWKVGKTFQEEGKKNYYWQETDVTVTFTRNVQLFCVCLPPWPSLWLLVQRTADLLHMVYLWPEVLSCANYCPIFPRQTWQRPFLETKVCTRRIVLYLN